MSHLDIRSFDAAELHDVRRRDSGLVVQQASDVLRQRRTQNQSQGIEWSAQAGATSKQSNVLWQSAAPRRQADSWSAAERKAITPSVSRRRLSTAK
jgi:NADPH-dependent ferric siderophore reductase